jgi:hypothetical protein
VQNSAAPATWNTGLSIFTALNVDWPSSLIEVFTRNPVQCGETRHKLEADAEWLGNKWPGRIRAQSGGSHHM